MIGEAIGKLREGVDEVARAVTDELREDAEQVRDAALEALPSTDDLLVQAVLVPGVRIDREGYLREALHRHRQCEVDAAVATSPADAGVSVRELHRLAGKSLGKEARRTTVLSFAAGIPGGAAAAATIPADMVQLYGHLLRAVQMLSYLYGWRDTCHIEEGEMSEATRRALVLFLGVMAGDERADEELARLAPLRERDGVRTALLSSDAMREVSDSLGARMAQRVAGQAVGKAVPIAGAVISGTMSYGGFSDMWKRLRHVLDGIG